MKKKLLAFVCLLILLSSSADAKNIKVEALDEFNVTNPPQSFSVKTIQSEILKPGLYLEPGTIITGQMKKLYSPKRGKRNGYFEFVPMEVIESDKTININNSIGVASLAEYIPVDPPKIVLKVTVKTASLFLHGIVQGIEFVQGAAQAESGNRLKSGVMNVYQNSFLSYVEFGNEVDIQPGTILVFKIQKAK